jgi:hypothetical protein
LTPPAEAKERERFSCSEIFVETADGATLGVLKPIE